MGTEDNAIPPSRILKKGSGVGGGAGDANSAKQTGFSYDQSKRAPIPSKEELRDVSASLKHKDTKNFITSNAVENILSVPKQAAQPTDWLKKKDFGQVPKYLSKIKSEINDEYEYIRSMQQQQEEEQAAGGMRLLPEEERLKLIDELKAKWDSVNSTYQQSSVLSLASLDTIGKVKRKEMYEAQLAQIEKDIEKLSKKFVYVRCEDEE
jgi:hypothetical protein